MTPSVPAAPASCRAFTLVEMLTVIVIITILSTVAIPALVGITMGSALVRAGTLLEDNLNIARQRALASQREIDVRFYKCVDPDGSSNTKEYRALQLFEKRENGAVQPVTPIIFLQHQMIMINQANYSSLLAGGSAISPKETPPNDAPVAATPTTPAQPADPLLPGIPGAKPSLQYVYEQFAFRAAGDTDLLDKTADYFITIASTKAGSKPTNFYTVTVDPLSAKIYSYRP